MPEDVLMSGQQPQSGANTAVTIEVKTLEGGMNNGVSNVSDNGAMERVLNSEMATRILTGESELDINMQENKDINKKAMVSSPTKKAPGLAVSSLDPEEWAKIEMELNSAKEKETEGYSDAETELLEELLGGRKTKPKAKPKAKLSAPESKVHAHLHLQ